MKKYLDIGSNSAHLSAFPQNKDKKDNDRVGTCKCNMCFGAFDLSEAIYLNSEFILNDAFDFRESKIKTR